MIIMAEEKEFFAGDDTIDILPTSNDLDTKVKEHRDQMIHHYAVVIADPYKSNTVLNEMRRNIVALCTTLMEHNIPLDLPKKDRNAEDVLKEAAGELGAMFGAQGVAAGLSFVRQVKDNITSSAYIEIYEDDDGLYFINDNGDEVPCDMEGNILNEEESDD